MKLKFLLFMLISLISFGLNEADIDNGVKILDNLTNGRYEKKLKSTIDREIDKKIVPIKMKSNSIENTIDSIINSMERTNGKNPILKVEINHKENPLKIKVIYCDEKTEILEFSNGQRIVISK